MLIGPAAASESYLSVDAIVGAAKASGAQAVHPGYGFLSENPSLPAACQEAGITFIGPPADVINIMGSKIAARRLAQAAGVPVVPGETPADQSDAAIVAAATRIGFPLLLKPSEGGGGIGMKAVRDAASLAGAIAQAQREAMAAFGDGTLYVERLVEKPRHIEFQILADHHGRSRPPLRARVLDSAPASEGDRGDAIDGVDASRCGSEWATRRSRSRARPDIATPAPSSSCSMEPATPPVSISSR